MCVSDNVASTPKHKHKTDGVTVKSKSTKPKNHKDISYYWLNQETTQTKNNNKKRSYLTHDPGRFFPVLIT